MKRSFILNLILLLCANLLIKPFYVLVIDVTVQNVIGPQSYGLFFSLFNFCFLFQILADFGIQNYNSKNLSANRDLIKHETIKLLGIKLVLSFVFLAAVLIFSLCLNYPAEYYPILLIIAFNQIILSFILYLRTNFSAMGFYRLNSLFSVIDKLILISILSYLLWFWPDRSQFTLYHFIGAQTLSLSAALISILAVSYFKSFIPGISFSISSFRNVLLKSWPYASVIILMTAYSRMDGVMIERMLADGQHEAGIYAAAFRLLDASNMLGFLFVGLLLPMFARMISIRENVIPLLSMALRIMLVLSFTLVFSCVFYNDQIIRLLYPTHGDPYYVMILTILIFSFISMGVSNVLGSLLTANGNIRQLNAVFLSGVLLNFLLNWFLIEALKAYGAAIATLITQFLVMAGQTYWVLKLFRITIPKVQLLRFIGYVVLSISSIGLIAHFTVTHWFYLFICGAMVSFMVSFLIKFITAREIIITLRKRPESFYHQ